MIGGLATKGRPRALQSAPQRMPQDTSAFGAAASRPRAAGLLGGAGPTLSLGGGAATPSAPGSERAEVQGAPGGPVQARLAVQPAGDKFEREADAASDNVLAGRPVGRVSRLAPSPGECPACATAKAQGLQRKCATCAQRDSDASAPGASTSVDSGRAERAMAGAGSGSPLNPDMRGAMEQHFGADFGGVRVHRNPTTDEANRALGARAFTRGSDIYLRHDSTPDDRGLMAHELTHVVQQSAAGSASVQRQPAPEAANHIDELRVALGSGNKNQAVDAIKAMSRAEGEQVLANPGFRMLADWTFDQKEMVEALRLMPGNLERKMEWLRSKGGGFDEIEAVIDASPKAERPALYARADLRDWITGIPAVYGEIYMKNLVLHHLGGTLRQQLGWIKAEGGTNFGLLLQVLGAAPAVERAALLDDSEMRAFFAANVKDYEMKWVVDTLGGPLSAQMEWLQAKGTDEAPEAAAKTLPSLSPRDAELLDRLEGEGELPKLYADYVGAEVALAAYRDRGGGTTQFLPAAPIDAGELQVLSQKYNAAAARLDAALARQFPGIADSFFFDARELRIAAFFDQIRRFEALFVGFGLQTAFAMLADNQRVAMQERDRYARAREADALLYLLSINLWGSRRAHIAINFSWKGADLSPFFSAEDLQTYPILTHPKFFDNTLIRIIDDYRPGHAKEEDLQGIAAHVREVCDSVIDNISETRSSLNSDTDKLWQLDGVLDQAKQGLGIVKGSLFDRLIERKLDRIHRNDTFRTIALMALVIALTILSAGTGTAAILGSAALVAVSAAGAVQSYRNYAFTSAAHGASLDPARALTQVDPSAVWLAVDVLSVFLDLHGFVSAINKLAKPAAAMVEAGKATEATRGVLEGETRRVASELEVGKDIVSREALVSGVVEAAERRAAEKVAIRADLPKTIRLRDDLRALGKEGEALANDNGVVAGLLSLEEGTQQAVLRAFRHEPELVGRLGAFAGPAGERAVGIDLLRNGLGEAGFENVMRDLLRRRDLSRADALLRAVDKDVLTIDEIKPLAAAANRSNPAARAAALDAEVDRLVTKSSGLPAPGSQAERAALNQTRGLTEVKDPEHDLVDELAYLQRRNPQPIEDGEYVAEVALPNGHTWKMNRYGHWCRFSGVPFCLTSEGLNQIVGRVTPAERLAETTAPLGAPIYRVDPRRPPDVVPPGVVLEFPTGERVFRAGDGGIVIESRLGRAGARRNFEAAYFSRGEMELDDYTRSLMERAHSQGAGTGFESPFAILYAPRVVNQDLQNTGIEMFLRELQKDYPETTFHLVTNTKVHPMSRRLSSIEYRIDISSGSAARKPLLQVEISLSDSAANPVIGISSTAVSPEMVPVLTAVDLPHEIRDRLAKIMQGRWRQRVTR